MAISMLLGAFDFENPLFSVGSNRLRGSMHAGWIPGSVRMNFGQAFRKEYREVMIPLFGQYLKRCYSTFVLIVVLP
jgi:hypothetical protein